MSLLRQYLQVQKKYLKKLKPLLLKKVLVKAIPSCTKKLKKKIKPLLLEKTLNLVILYENTNSKDSNYMFT